jgi:hypothetical protein
MTGKSPSWSVPSPMEATRGALMDLGKRDVSFGVLSAHITCAYLNFATDYLPSYVNSTLLESGIKGLAEKRIKGQSAH